VLLLLSVFLAAPPAVNTGPLSYSICQAGCAGVVTACYAAARAVWGATAGVAAAPAVIACHVAFRKCQAAYAVVALAPIP
ncbi:hypothetical protein GCG54_00010339, partial [Colletotrichum gloeosporioides]